jgi:hypothetical protein
VKRILVLAVIFCCSAVLFAQDLSVLHDVPKVHKFRLWNTLGDMDKVNFLMGFTNGLLTGAAIPRASENKPTQSLVACLLVDKGLSFDQAIAMIDKYYKENPEKWNILIGDAILEALTVKGGPCAGLLPMK